MKAKLVKDSNGYWLDSNDEVIKDFLQEGKLSKQNCDEIFGVVNVKKLAEDFVCDIFGEDKKEIDLSNGAVLCFIKGFNKAMELNKDKLFGVKEVVELCKILLSNPFEKCGKTYQELTDNYIQSLQQPTEIEVEVELICPHPSDTYVCGMEYGCDADGCNHPEQIPYLDKDGCLILKRL
jgi:hypothetical protein